ncbi:hypothetical protein lerEdw1_019187 [Lerista edwardsae]|nr:hypothetical protein lerEdw1_019187 [Lerista edwardsae]
MIVRLFFPTGAPVTITSAWILTRIYRQNTGCWDDDEESSAVLWIIKGPIAFTILVSFPFDLPRLAKSTLLLIPLFGAHYVVFAFFPESTGMVARLYIELGLGSFQGFVVALLYCFLNGEVQAEIKKRLGQWHHQHYLSFTRKHQSLSRDNSPVNYVTQLSLLDRTSPKRSTGQNGLSLV